MNDFWETFILNSAIGILSQVIKSPSSIAKYRNVLQHISDIVGAALATLPPAPPAV